MPGTATFRSLLRSVVDQADRQCEPHGSQRDLAACISRDVFFQKLPAAPADAVINTYAKAWAKCEAKAPLIAPTKAKAMWDEAKTMQLSSWLSDIPTTRRMRGL
jgi:hypothetical protein